MRIEDADPAAALAGSGATCVVQVPPDQVSISPCSVDPTNTCPTATQNPGPPHAIDMSDALLSPLGVGRTVATMVGGGDVAPAGAGTPASPAEHNNTARMRRERFIDSTSGAGRNRDFAILYPAPGQTPAL
ncbi:hypothetical protein Back2_07030 [Nocardioides baekrokdamisoli]|uniref:Uncharacterized protein n=1 Tax=Nocardioides baekrokdamisoli TaxID=1804624 RepID=A0A3G9IDI0_9ACTN|nr:hypothetical protein Back2_07030 [Nocardioides baekrokdamisoli]